MILFVALWQAPVSLITRAKATLVDVGQAFPARGEAPIESTDWAGEAHLSWCISQPSVNADVLKSVDRVAAIDGLALLDGRFLTAQELCLDAPSKPATTADEIDGQFAAVCAGPGHLAIRTDPLGLRPIYWARCDGAWILANRVEILAKLTHDVSVSSEAAASFVATGWVLGGKTLAPTVRIVPADQHWSWRRASRCERAAKHQRGTRVWSVASVSVLRHLRRRSSTAAGTLQSVRLESSRR